MRSGRQRPTFELVLLVSVFAVFLQGQHPLGDAKYSLLVSENLLHGKGFAIGENSIPKPGSPFSGPGPAYSRGYPYQVEPVNGRLLYFYPVGGSILAAPLVALMNVAGFSALTHDGRYDEDEERFASVCRHRPRNRIRSASPFTSISN